MQYHIYLKATYFFEHSSEWSEPFQARKKAADTVKSQACSYWISSYCCDWQENTYEYLLKGDMIAINFEVCPHARFQPTFQPLCFGIPLKMFWEEEEEPFIPQYEIVE